MTHDTEPPIGLVDCETCPPARAWKSASLWTRVLVPCLLGLIVSVAGGMLALWRADAVRATDIAVLDRGRADNREEIRRLRADLLELERGHAVRQEQTIEAITKTQTQLDGLTVLLAEERRGRR